MAVRSVTFDPEALSRCVGCGLCLPACPTFQVTHAEHHGPRGRIAGMRLLEAGEVDAHDTAWTESMESCVQCRACEPACPSGVAFGSLMERAREVIHEDERALPASGWFSATAERALLLAVASRAALVALSLALALAQAIWIDRLLPARLRVPRRVRVRDLLRPLRQTAGVRPAFLFRGCVMDTLFRGVHRATLRVLGAAGFAVRVTPAPRCCGALHLHAGRVDRARELARRVVAAYAGTTGDIVVNSAGCGAAMREYDRLLGTEEAAAFSKRVRDFSETVLQGDLPPLRALERRVAYQSACHLRNVLRADQAPERLLRRIPGVTVVRPTDGELCCGAGGAYSLFQPRFAARIRDQKRQALDEVGGTIVVSTNPGCILHLAGAGVPMVHVAELVASALPPESTT